MLTFIPSRIRQVLKLQCLAVVAVLGIVPLWERDIQAQESYYGSSTTGIETTSSWPWWQSLYYRRDGSARYGKHFKSAAGTHKNQLPVTPPICGPTYGYYQPCWRQIPLVRRCVTCETFQPNREIPFTTNMPPLSPTQVPPAPEAAAEKDEEHTDPDLPELAPIP